jgi:ssDNA thymidine ADP-ribosyltransferase, DarT
MTWTPPKQAKLYHIVHVDRLPSIVADGRLYCDAEMSLKTGNGTTIGMPSIKARRLTAELASHPGLHVGECVPFYFCPRSIMLYILYCANNSELTYRGGQQQIIHLQFDMNTVAKWAEGKKQRWAFTLSNAGSNYFEDRCNLGQLDEINWDAIKAEHWAGALKEGKQAEFLVEKSVPWELVEEVVAIDQKIATQVAQVIRSDNHRPVVQVRPNWYY